MAPSRTSQLAVEAGFSCFPPPPGTPVPPPTAQPSKPAPTPKQSPNHHASNPVLAASSPALLPAPVGASGALYLSFPPPPSPAPSSLHLGIPSPRSPMPQRLGVPSPVNGHGFPPPLALSPGAVSPEKLTSFPTPPSGQHSRGLPAPVLHGVPFAQQQLRSKTSSYFPPHASGLSQVDYANSEDASSVSDVTNPSGTTSNRSSVHSTEPPYIFTPPSGGLLSGPPSADEISFFPVPPLHTPMAPDEKVDELLIKMMGMAMTPNGERPGSVGPQLAPKARASLLAAKSSTPVQAVKKSTQGPELRAPTPIRPAKTPLAAQVLLSEEAITKPTEAERAVRFATPRTTTPPRHEPVNAEQRPKPSLSHRTAKPVSSFECLRAVTSCLDTPVTFKTTWYSHPSAREFVICSRCYIDHIFPTSFSSAFKAYVYDDGKPRQCRFSKPRMKDVLFKQAVASGSLHPTFEWMRLRTSIPDCKGLRGAKGDASTQWYHPKSNDMLGFAVCQACYEDHIMAQPLSSIFQPHSQALVKDATLTCDMAIPYIRRTYEQEGGRREWSKFVTEAKARLGFPACPQRTGTMSQGKTWFRPVDGPEGLVLCVSCYCDHVIHSGEERKWIKDEQLSLAPDQEVYCGLGEFNIRMAMARSHETSNFSHFWSAVDKLSREPICDDQGVTDGTWYTLVSDPEGYQICGACYVGIAEPLGICPFLLRKTNIPRGTTLQCCCSVAHPRFDKLMPLLLELYYTRDASALASYADVYASIPPCPRDNDATNRRWYGWLECTICPECYHDFARQHPNLIGKAPLHGHVLEANTMCEMYSPRMRELFLECARKTDPAPLLAFSEKRRMVFVETVLPTRMLLFRAQAALGQTPGLPATSAPSPVSLGPAEHVGLGAVFAYRVPARGTFDALHELRGASPAQQKLGVGASAAGGMAQLDALEKKWKAVE